MFLILFRNIVCPQQMFPSLRNAMSNNVSATKRGIQWSLRAFVSMQAVSLFLRARAVTNFVMRWALKKLQIGEQRVNFPPVGISLLLRRCFVPRHLQNRTTGAKLGNHSQQVMQLTASYVWYAVWYRKITSLNFTRVSGCTLNGIWSFLKPCLQTSPVSFNKLHQNEEAFFRNIHGTRMLLLLCFPVYHKGNIVFAVSFSKMEIMLTLHGREF